MLIACKEKVGGAADKQMITALVTDEQGLPLQSQFYNYRRLIQIKLKYGCLSAGLQHRVACSSTLVHICVLHLCCPHPSTVFACAVSCCSHRVQASRGRSKPKVVQVLGWTPLCQGNMGSEHPQQEQHGVHKPHAPVLLLQDLVLCMGAQRVCAPFEQLHTF